MDGFDLKAWEAECEAYEAQNVILLEDAGYLVAIVDDKIRVETTGKNSIDAVVQRAFDDGRLAYHMRRVAAMLDNGINTLAEAMQLDADDISQALLDFDRRRLHKRYEVIDITNDQRLGIVNTMHEATRLCRQSGSPHCAVIDRQAAPGKVRRYEFRDGILNRGYNNPGLVVG